MYDGQVSLLRRLLKSEALEEVQCSSVDRYQGVNNGSANRQMYMNNVIYMHMNCEHVCKTIAKLQETSGSPAVTQLFIVFFSQVGFLYGFDLSKLFVVPYLVPR